MAARPVRGGAGGRPLRPVIGRLALPGTFLVYQATAEVPILLWDVAIPADRQSHHRAPLAIHRAAHQERQVRRPNEPAESRASASLDDLG